MPVPDFSPGEVLTAAAMESISGWLVKSQAVGTGVSSVTVTGAFSADYENYRIIYSNGVASATDANISIALGASTASYDEGLIYNTFASATVNGFQRQNQTSWVWAGNANQQQNLFNMDLFGPFTTRYTYYKSNGFSSLIANALSSGVHKVATSYSGFTLTPTGGTITGGTIRVYGYRN
jgi:hypothetical protein